MEDGLDIIAKDWKQYSENEEKKKFNDLEKTTCSNEKYPLAMLLCLLADGRQLTLYEIDRILCYLLEKKASMLTLPQGTLPPLPVQYSMNNRTNDNSKIIEQIEDILSNNFSVDSDQRNCPSSFVDPSLNLNNPNLYSTLPNTAAAHAAAAIFQAYSQFNIPTNN